jgi:hypothetical protein
MANAIGSNFAMQVQFLSSSTNKAQQAKLLAAREASDDDTSNEAEEDEAQSLAEASGPPKTLDSFDWFLYFQDQDFSLPRAMKEADFTRSPRRA